jgi:hypothetical protein
VRHNSPANTSAITLLTTTMMAPAVSSACHQGLPPLRMPTAATVAHGSYTTGSSTSANARNAKPNPDSCAVSARR